MIGENIERKGNSHPASRDNLLHQEPLLILLHLFLFLSRLPFPNLPFSSLKQHDQPSQPPLQRPKLLPPSRPSMLVFIPMPGEGEEVLDCGEFGQEGEEGGCGGRCEGWMVGWFLHRPSDRRIDVSTSRGIEAGGPLTGCTLTTECLQSGFSQQCLSRVATEHPTLGSQIAPNFIAHTQAISYPTSPIDLKHQIAAYLFCALSAL
jgi:hypothetical protein